RERGRHGHGAQPALGPLRRDQRPDRGHLRDPDVLRPAGDPAARLRPLSLVGGESSPQAEIRSRRGSRNRADDAPTRSSRCGDAAASVAASAAIGDSERGAAREPPTPPPLAPPPRTRPRPPRRAVPEGAGGGSSAYLSCSQYSAGMSCAILSAPLAPPYIGSSTWSTRPPPRSRAIAASIALSRPRIIEPPPA